MASDVHAMSYSQSWPEPGHRQATHLLLEGVTGLDDIYKSISKGIDSDFYHLFKEKFGSYPSGNHRILGHWGFSGAIPFNDEPYKSALAKYPKNEVAKLWQTYVSSIIHDVASKTGLEKKQAQALAGLIYNSHILTDYTGAELKQLAKPTVLIDDFQKNLSTLFGEKSDFTKGLMRELTCLSKSKEKLSTVEKADRMYQVLVKHNIGEKFVEIYKKQLTPKGIRYDLHPGKRALYDKAAKGMNARYFQSGLAQAITAMDGKNIRPTQTVEYLKSVQGVLQEVNVKGRKAFVLSIPLQFNATERIASQMAKTLIDKARSQGHMIDEGYIKRQIAAKLQTEVSKSLKTPISPEVAERVAQQSLNWAKINPMKVGFEVGIMTFIFLEGTTVYRWAQGTIDNDAFVKETTRNLGQAFLTGGATYCAVLLGATPTGWVVFGIGIGVNVAWNFAFSKLEKEFSTPEISLNDIMGKLPTEIQRRESVWSYSGYECLFDYQGTRNTLFEPERLSCPTVFDPPPPKKTVFDYTTKKTSLFE